MTTPGPKLDLLDWRRRVATLYADVRAEPDPAAGRELWRTGRDELLRTHPQSPLKPGDPMRDSGVPVWPYDPELRWELELEPAEDVLREMDSANDGMIRMRRIGQVSLPAPVEGTLDVWWFEQYGGGLFLPFKDATAGHTSYGAGRYLLDTVKGADLGTHDDRFVFDFNFAYNPSCSYDPSWSCPLAPPGNRLAVAINAGERVTYP